MTRSATWARHLRRVTENGILWFHVAAVQAASNRGRFHGRGHPETISKVDEGFAVPRRAPAVAEVSGFARLSFRLRSLSYDGTSRPDKMARQAKDTNIEPI